MKKWIQYVLISLLACDLLSACRPSQEELDATSTQVAAYVFATQTAQAPTTTATFTPSPTATLTPTDKPEPINTPLPSSTATPSQEMIDAMQEAYQYFVFFDLITKDLITTVDDFDGGIIDRNQVDARLQFIQHTVGIFLSHVQLSETLYQDELLQTGEKIFQTCRQWWNSESDLKKLRQEMTTYQESFQPRLIELRADLQILGELDVEGEQSFSESFNQAFMRSDAIVEDLGSYDIFQGQRLMRSTLWAIAPVLGDFSEEEGYISPQETFQCKFDFTWIDGDLLYDYVLTERTVAVFTNDFGEGQAVEWRPLEAAPADANAAKVLVDGLFHNTMLPSLTQQHSGLIVLEQKWVELPGDPPVPTLQVILKLPEASFIVELDSNGGEKYSDVVRGLWIFIKGSQVYTVIYQPDLFYATKEGMADAEYIQVVLDGLSALQQNCVFK